MRVLVIAAHPDDETVFCGGTIAKYAAEGHEVVILLTTRGEGGEAGDPPLCPQDELGWWREREARAAGAALGATAVRFLPFCDPLGREEDLHHIDATLEEFSAAIAEVMAALRPDVVITHGSNGEYGHPQHIFTHQAVFAALRRLAPWQPREVLTWGAAYPNPEKPRHINRDDPADLVLDVTPWLERKIAALEAHRTQHGLFLRNNPGKTLADVPGRLESFRRWSLEQASQEASC
ncbi:PIG-L deacetylase family protein [Kallotenue papyrolyticum]|uniref:PIG-L deacetylase family protein n=1 Tax=Kallotenue papyrolyticum TaxID=1325125 RepID=UPI0004785AF3|nr:PIG-L deacetylase family protein [Kallotenue papyrolyticum]